jgi:hypothetical protein
MAAHTKLDAALGQAPYSALAVPASRAPTVLSSAYRSDAEAKCPRHRSTYAPNVASVPSQGTRRIVLRRYERRGVPEAVRVAAQLIREASGNFSFNSGEPRGRS